MRETVRNEKIAKIRRLIILQCFESDRSNLECNALGNRKLMQGTKSRRNVMGTANGWDILLQAYFDIIEGGEEKYRVNHRRGSYSSQVWNGQETWQGQ